MLNKIEFSDLYKFLTSIGFIAIVFAFILPWLFMNQDNTLSISQLDYSCLTEDSKNLVDQKIFLNLKVIKLLPYISSLLFILGASLTIIGIRNWIKKQRIVDETDSHNLTILKSSNLSEERIDEKIEREVKQELSSEDDSNNESENSKKDLKTQEEIEELKVNLSNIELIFFDKIKAYNAFKYEPLFNMNIEGKYEVDIVLKPNNPNKYHDKYIEIKYLQSKLNMRFVKEAFGSIMRMMNFIHDKTTKKHRFYLILVYKSNIAETEEITRFKIAVGDYLSQWKTPYLDVILIDDNQARNFDISYLFK